MSYDFEKNKCDSRCGSNESVITLKVFDQCRMKECSQIGPALSNENSVCVILQSNENERFGRVVLPGLPITIPDTARKVKVVTDSFQTEKIEIMNISPTLGRNGYWDIEIQFTYVYRLKFYDTCMHVMKILHCTDDSDSSGEGSYITDSIRGAAKYTYNVTLYGSQEDTPLTASDLFPYDDHSFENAPHTMIEAKPYLMGAELINSDNPSDGQSVLDDNYDEPFFYAYITVGLFAVVRLFRFVNIIIPSNGYDVADPCENTSTDPCDALANIDFPYQEFFPKSQSITRDTGKCK